MNLGDVPTVKSIELYGIVRLELADSKLDEQTDLKLETEGESMLV